MASVDSEMFEQLVNDVKSHLFYYIYSIIGNKDLAEEALQNTLLKAYIKLDGLNDICNFKKWILAIAKNEAITQIRKHNHRFATYDDATSAMISENHDDGMMLQDDSETLEDRLIREDREHLLVQAVNQLKPQDRRIIILRYYSQLTWKEIECVLGINRNSLVNRHKRIMAKLYNILIESNVIEENTIYSKENGMVLNERK